MANDTKDKIIEVALKMFAEKGYLGSSMNDIADKLGITKAALYKHYSSKQEILNSIINKMNENDLKRIYEYDMPLNDSADFADEYMNISIENIQIYTLAQFKHWTEDKFSSDFRKMLTLEQYHNPYMADLYHKYLVGGPIKYMTEIFIKMTGSDEKAKLLAIEFYGPIFILYSLYDEGNEVLDVLKLHVDSFVRRLNKEIL